MKCALTQHWRPLKVVLSQSLFALSNLTKENSAEKLNVTKLPSAFLSHQFGPSVSLATGALIRASLPFSLSLVQHITSNAEQKPGSLMHPCLSANIHTAWHGTRHGVCSEKLGSPGTFSMQKDQLSCTYFKKKSKYYNWLALLFAASTVQMRREPSLHSPHITLVCRQLELLKPVCDSTELPEMSTTN